MATQTNPPQARTGELYIYRCPAGADGTHPPPLLSRWRCLGIFNVVCATRVWLINFDISTDARRKSLKLGVDEAEERRNVGTTPVVKPGGSTSTSGQMWCGSPEQKPRDPEA